jgi:peptidyl-dipeptidase Dcp
MKSLTRLCIPKPLLILMTNLIATGTIAIGSLNPTLAAAADFGPSNPFYAPSTLPFEAPPFDKIKDEDYQPAIEAAMAQQQAEIQAIADNPDAPTFENTIVAMEKSGRLFDRVLSAFFGVTGANTNDTLQNVKTIEAPKLAAHQDFIFLNTKLFARVAAIYKQRGTLKLDPESLRLLEYDYDQFVHLGANLSEADKTELKKMNEELSSLSDSFTTKLLAELSSPPIKPHWPGSPTRRSPPPHRPRKTVRLRASSFRCKIPRSSQR